MLIMQELNHLHFKTGAILTAMTALVLLALTAVMGKNESFLLLNKDLGPFADQFFRYWTYLGDGIVWIPLFALFVTCRRKLLPLLFSAIIISTLFAQLTKNYIVPHAPRPTAAISDQSLIHTVPGVIVHTAYSFPSGHTTTAFTIFLLACLLVRWKWIIPAGLLYALLVGYSRIYLAQHFPLDVGAGMVAGLLTVLLSLPVQKQFDQSYTVQRNGNPE
ncbi:MAG: lipid A 1-phosphatase LpxE [Sediminibacterium sp.]